MHAAAGILTARGGMTSHAAVVARGMGRPCVCGAGALRIDDKAGTHDGRRRRRSASGDVITIDGATGEVLEGRVQDAPAGAVRRLRHADGLGRRGAHARRARQRRHAARCAARRASSAPRASACAAPSTCSSRTSRILAMREMICADDEAGRRTALAKMLPMQRDDFEELFEIMAGLPVTIRLLDPPLHEFLPHEREGGDRGRQGARRAAGEAAGARRASCTSSTRCWASAAAGSASAIPRSPRCRRAPSSRPRSTRRKKTGKPVDARGHDPAGRLPRASSTSLRDVIVATAQAVEKETGAKLDYQVGTMIELPRAALMADEIAGGEAAPSSSPSAPTT